MTISKERLEELIKDGATIYCLDDKIVYLIRLNEHYNVSGMSFANNDIFEYCLYYKDILYKPLSKIYETQERAEWHLKYYRTRTEELDLPTWEEIKDIKNNKTIVSFYAKDKETDTVYMYMYAKHLIVETEYKEFLNTEFTEENYIKACDLCLKLFEGEEKC